MNIKGKFETEVSFIRVFIFPLSSSFIIPISKVYSQTDLDFEKEDIIQIC